METRADPFDGIMLMLLLVAVFAVGLGLGFILTARTIKLDCVQLERFRLGEEAFSCKIKGRSGE